MVFGTLYTFPGDHARTIGIKAVAKANGLDLKVVEQPKSPEHLAVSKLGKVPAFEGADGFKLFECISIALYVTSQNEQSTLFGDPKDKKQYYDIIKWMSFCNSEVLASLVDTMLPLAGYVPYDKERVDATWKRSERAVGVVEEELANKTYLVGDQLTLADVFCAGLLSGGFTYFYGKTWREEHPNTARWFEHVRTQPIYADVTGTFEYLDEPKMTNTPPEKKTEA